MNARLTAALPPFIAALVALVGTRLLIGALTRRQILDHPNHRSSHDRPTPRGGGLAVVAAVVAGWGAAFALGQAPSALLWPLVAAGGLAVVSFLDDLYGLGARLRLLAQSAAVALGLWGVPGHGLFGEFLPAPVDWVVTAVIWLWFINLFNFMDGIDGISGVETVVIAGGLAGAAYALGGTAMAGLFVPALVVVAAAAGFLRWNWHPARIFLGDVGSVPLGYLLGWLAIAAAGLENVGGPIWTACLILPLYYFVDATVTLFRRLARGANIFEAHREHFYQQAVMAGRRHDQVAGAVALCGAGLWGAAWGIAPWAPFAGLGAGALLVGALIVWMRRAPR